MSRLAADGSFSAGKGGGSDVEYGYKGKGNLQHILVEGHGNPVSHTVTGANSDERKQVDILLSQVEPLLKPLKEQGIIPIFEADKGYDSAEVRTVIVNRKIVPDIPYRKGNEPNEKPAEQTGWTSIRWMVERCHAWLQRKFRRYAVRWERLPELWQAIVNSCLFIFWIQKLVG